jgi:hypothetical protein
LLWFVSRKFTGKSRVFLISVFFPPKSKLYVISSSVKASNVKVLICYAFGSFFLFFNEKSENFESLLPGNCWNPEKLRYRSNFSLIEISAILFWYRFASLGYDDRPFQLTLYFLVFSYSPTLDVLCVNANFSAKFLSNSVLESKNFILNILLFGPHPAIQNWFNWAYEKPANSWQISDLTCCSFAWFSTLLSDCLHFLD